ncbi:MAG: hypothetical protein Fur005_43030 [Roseiflexaceae bacterium]
MDIAVSSSGTIWIAGNTRSGDFLGSSGTRYDYGVAPSDNQPQGFLTEIMTDTQTVIRRIYFGGISGEKVTSLALDSQDRPAVTGWTTSSLLGISGTNRYPVTAATAYQSTSLAIGADSADAFVTQFSADGSSMRYSSLLSGPMPDYGNGIAVDGDELYVIGSTISPSSSGGQTGFAVTPDAYQSSYVGGWDAFVVRINPAATTGPSSLRYGTLLGGNNNNGTNDYDRGYGIAARDGIAYVTGVAGHSTFPLINPLQTYQAKKDIFVAAIDTTTSAMPLSSFLGGSDNDEGRAIVVLPDKRVYVAGFTTNTIVVNNVLTTNQQAFLSQLHNGPLTFTVTDANGQPVSGLALNEDGWPSLNASGSGAIANPLTVTAIVANPTQQTQSFLVEVEIGQAIAGTDRRFVPYDIPTSCIENNKITTAQTYHFVRVTCLTSNLQANGSLSYQWRVWVQPSLATNILFKARMTYLSTTLIDQETADITVPKANIRPVILAPGFLGSGLQEPNGPLVLDPIAGVYNGLFAELRILGYEDGTTIVPFPYRWFGGINGPLDAENPTTIPNLANQLKTVIDTWWVGKTVPAYARSDSFDLIAHSTGGIITRQYVVNQGNNGKLHTVIFVAVPNQGSPAAYAGWEGQDTVLGPSEDRAPTAGIQRNRMHTLFQDLAIKAGCFTPNNYRTNSRHATDENIYDYVHGQPCRNGAQPGVPLLQALLPSDGAATLYPYLQRGSTFELGPTSPVLNTLNQPALVDSFIQSITAPGSPTPGRLFMAYTTNLVTLRGYTIDTKLSLTPLWINGQSVPINWNRGSLFDGGTGGQDGFVYELSDSDQLGDGTVPLWSADLREITTLDHLITTITFTDTDHIEYFNKPESRRFIGRLVVPFTADSYYDSLPYQVPVVPNDAQKAWGITFHNLCPVTMLITDSLGRRIGTTPSGQDVNEIPGATYTGHHGDADPDYIWIPTPATGTYTVTITGVEAGFYQISAEAITPTSQARLGLFSGDIQPGQVVTYTTTPYQPTAAPKLLLVDDYAGSATLNYYTSALTQLGRTADTWNVAQQGLPGIHDLYPYHAVIWVPGATSALTDTTALLMQANLAFGGAILLAGQDVEVGITTPSILTDTLQAQLNNPNVTGTTLQGIDLLNGLTLTLNGGDSANNQVSSNSMQVLGDAQPLAIYTNGSGNGQAGGLRYSANGGRFVYLGFGIEGLQTATERQAVLGRVLDWLEDGGVAPGPAFPTTGILDDFNRADGSIGPNWSGETSNFAIVGNTLQNISGGYGRIGWTTSFAANQEVYTTIDTIPSTADEINLILKDEDRGDGWNFLEVWYQPQSGTVQVWSVHNWGTWIQHGGDIAITFQPGDQFGARANADGTVEIYKNGTLVGSVTVSAAWPSRDQGGRVGVWLIAANTVVFDDIGGGSTP